ncbi:hypothetical protein LTR29_009207 [Friedmanniomyces endolithicus]|nr:hypothetical protein LTR29_009207 [Friedmanniomyces endolithicus]
MDVEEISSGSEESESIKGEGTSMAPEPRATSVQGSMRHTFARPDQASIGYLFRLKMVFAEMPQPLRILRVPSTTTFHQFHLTAFDYTNSHLYRFKLHTLRQPGERRPYYPPDPNEIMKLDERFLGDPRDREYMRPEELEKLRLTREVKLWQIYENAEWRAKGVVGEYIYDFGNTKTFNIQFMGQADNQLGKAIGKGEEQDVFCVAGEGCPVDEDDDYKDREEPWSWEPDQVNKDLKKLCRLNVYTKQS